MVRDRQDQQQRQAERNQASTNIQRFIRGNIDRERLRQEQQDRDYLLQDEILRQDQLQRQNLQPLQRELLL